MTDAGSTAWSRDASAWDATEKHVYSALRDALDTGHYDADRRAALATVVAVDGSAYRRPGAKMLVAGGNHLGAVTAGCLEGPIADLADEVLATGRAMIETHDLTDDDEWGMGLGCNGVVTVLVEPVDGSLWPALDTLADKQSAAVCTVVGDTDGADDTSDTDGADDTSDTDGADDTSDTGGPDDRVGARATITDEGTLQTGERPALSDAVLEAVSDTAEDCRERGHAEVVTVDGETAPGDDAGLRVFVDGLQPVADLLVFGSGEDIAPVARLGDLAGFRVVVASPRGGVATPDRFPGADDVRAVRAPDLDDLIDEPAHTYAVLMSHNFVDDQVALEALLETDVPYIGLMGPRKRFDALREELNERGVTLSERDRDRIATPVGLDIGGGQPVEIAFSIVSEAIAARYGREGGRLADQDDTIHPRTND